MPYKFVPDWLTMFTLRINDQFETGIFSPNEEGDKLDDLYFEDEGCVIGSTILIRDKPYIVKDVRFHCWISDGIGLLAGQKDAAMQVDLIVEEKAD